MKKLPDKKIIELLQSDIKKEYNYMFKYLKFHYFKPITRSLRNKGANQETAEEIFWDAMLIVDKYAKENKFKEDTNIEAFLRGVCNNILYKKFNRIKSTPTIPFLDELNNLEDDGIIPEIFLSDNLRDKLDYTTNQLGEKCKRIIHLAFFRGFTNEEIKSELEYNSVDVVKQTKRRCLKKLKDIIDRLGGKDIF